MSETPAYAAKLGSFPERRLHARHRVTSLAYVDIGTENGGIVVDLNEDGMAIQAVVPLARNTDVKLRVQLPNSRTTFETGAEVVWIGESKRLAGIRFQNLALEVRDHIEEWIRSETPKPPRLDPLTPKRVDAEAPAQQEILPETRKSLPETRKDRAFSSIAEFRLSPADPVRTGPAAERPVAEKPRPIPSLRELSSRLQASSASAPPDHFAHDTKSMDGPILAGEISHPKATRDSLEEADAALATARFDSGFGRPIWMQQSVTLPANDHTVAAQNVPSPAPDPLDAHRGLTEPSFRLGQARSPASGSLDSPGFFVDSKSTEALTGSTVYDVGALLKSHGAKIAAAAMVLLLFLIVCFVIWLRVRPAASPAESASASAGAQNQMVASVSETTDNIAPAENKSVPRSQDRTRSNASFRDSAQKNPKIASASNSLVIERTPNTVPFALSAPNLPPVANPEPLESNAAAAPVIDSSTLAPQSLATLTSPKLDENKVQPPEANQTPEAPRIVAGRVLRPTDRFNPCHLTYRVEPVYPADAVQQRVEGTVKIHQVVAADGSVRSVKLISGPELLSAPAMEAAQHWRYLPALLNGQPVETELDIQVDFRLPH